jgi:hypothetical protein
VSYRIAEKEYGCCANGGSLKRQLPPKRDTGCHSDSQIRHSNFELEGAYLPAYVGRGCCRKKDMRDTRPKPGNADRKQQYPSQETLRRATAPAQQRCEYQRCDE